MIDFPEFVDIVAGTYNVRHTSGTLRSNFESGFSKQRKAYCSGFKQVTFQINIPGHRKNDFVDWWDSIGKGAIWFLFVDPETLVKSRARLVEFNLELAPQDPQFRKYRAPISLEIFDG